MAQTFLIKPCGGACNFRCPNCFYRPISRQNDRFMSNLDTDILLSRISELPQSIAINIVFQGGEPLLIGYEYYRYFMQQVVRILPKRHISYSIQTNGSLLTEQLLSLFKKYDFLVGLSLDGDKSLNDRSRPTADGLGSYHMIMTAAKLMDKIGVNYNILTLITQNVAFAPSRVLSHHLNKDFRHLQFTMPIGYENNCDFLPTQQEMYRFLAVCFDEYASRLFTPQAISIRYFDNLISRIAYGHAEQCGQCGVCNPYIVVDPSLDCYPCDFYATAEYHLGNLRDMNIASMLSSERYASFMHSGSTSPKSCSSCRHIYLCGGGCKRYRGLSTEISASPCYYCHAISQFLDKFTPLLTSLAAKLPK